MVTWFPGELDPAKPFLEIHFSCAEFKNPIQVLPHLCRCASSGRPLDGTVLTFRQSPIDLCPSPGLVKKSVVQVEVVEMSFSLFPYTLICGLLFKRETQGFPILFSNTLFLKHSWLTYVGLYHRHPKICTFCTQPCFFLEWAPNLHFTTYGHPE